MADFLRLIFNIYSYLFSGLSMIIFDNDCIGWRTCNPDVCVEIHQWCQRNSTWCSDQILICVQ